MKAFRFRLEQALRWRAAELDLEKSRTAAVAQRLDGIRAALGTLRADLSGSTAQLGPVSDGATLQNLNAWTGKTLLRIADLQTEARKAEGELALRTRLMLEANRRSRAIENLKQTEQTEWRHEFSRELEAFAGETFLSRLQSKKRARSSGG